MSPPRISAAPPQPPRRRYLAPRPLQARPAQRGERAAGSRSRTAELSAAGPGPGRARVGAARPVEAPPGRGLGQGQARDGAAAAPGAPRPSAAGLATLWSRLAGEDSGRMAWPKGSAAAAGSTRLPRSPGDSDPARAGVRGSVTEGVLASGMTPGHGGPRAHPCPGVPGPGFFFAAAHETECPW